MLASSSTQEGFRNIIVAWNLHDSGLCTWQVVWGGEGRMGALRLRLGISTETVTSQDLAVNSSNSGGKEK
jgi:hypothetical protein